MAAAWALKRVLRLETECGLSKLRSLHTCKAAPNSSVALKKFQSNASSISFYGTQLAKPNGNRAFLVDTLKLVKNLEAQGVPLQQAEAITSAIVEVLNDSLENVGHSFLSKAEMQKVENLQKSNIDMFKSEIKNSQEHHFSLLQRETEKLQNDIEKMRSDLRYDKLSSDLRYELDKVTAGLRLDLNLEKGRIRDELAKHSVESGNLTNKIDREIHALKAQLEAGKYDVMKYCIGTLVSVSAVGLAFIRIMTLDNKK